MLVRFTPAARRDLVDITRFIADESPRRAASFVRELKEACSGLAEHPQRFAVLTDYAHVGYRRRPLGHYAIIYTVTGDEVAIVRVISSWLDMDSALDEG